MPKRDADIFEVLISQMGKYRDINFVLGKALGVLGHAELFEPVCNLLHGRKPQRPSLRCSGREYSTKLAA